MDEYKVSFNSDTSDSEEEESHTAVKTPPAVGVANNVSVNGDTTTANEETEEASRSGGLKALIEPREVNADGCLVNGDAGSRKRRGKNKDNIVGTANGMNGVSDAGSEGGRTVISAKDGILRTGSGPSQAAIDNVGETSDAEPLKSSCTPPGPEETSADPGCTAARGGGTNEESFNAQQVTPNPDTSAESNIRENGDGPVPSCDASIDLGDVGTFTLNTELVSDPAGESLVPESSYAEASSDVIVIKTTSSSSTDLDNANDNKAGDDLQAPGSNVDSTETSELASASTRAARGTDDKLHSSDENMDDYRRPTARPMDETELLIQRILAEAKAEASGDAGAKEKGPTERTRCVSGGDGEPSLRDRRGLDTRLGNLFPSDDRWEDSGYEATPSWVDYRGRRDVHAMRSRFRDNGRQYEQGTYRDADGYHGRYGGRYDDEEDEEIVFEDSEFVPQRREETEEVVKEKTTDIRNMVDKQATVLQKLKEASESFDDISAEIRAIKQDFLESQYRRSFMMDDDDYDDRPPYYSYQPDSYRRDVPRYTSSYAGTYESPYPRPALTLDPELESDLPVAHSRSRYDTTSSYYPSSRYTSGLTGTSSYSSRSLFDDDIGDEDTEERYGSNRALAPRDDDEESTSGTRSYSFDSALSSATSTLPSYRSKYGLTSSLYSSGVRRYTGVLPRASTLPDPTEHTGFTSRFLSKVRDQKNAGDEPRSPKRDKPFKSRFLRKSYDSDYGSHASTPATTPSPVSHFPVLSCQPAADTTAVLDTDNLKLNRDDTTA
ncbi:hypothetical protein NP493_323g01010 [Ridgeia piscesae]|uniref:Uncharacterized protein n=1 Tax=Ridgeia piscesae TaxID=27915 RepID=A0AAD9NVV9_RIDPI|nr:hypothetical protein NP493_323g01010 [Ridgeia piscesae]